MKNTKLLSEAIQAFIEGDKELAESKIRKHFVESAIEINKNLEEDFEIEEDIHTDPEASFQSEVKYPIEENEEEVQTDEFKTEDGETTETETDEFKSEEPTEEEKPEEIKVSGDSWDDIMKAIDELSAVFGEIQADAQGAGEAEEITTDVDGEETETDEFADVEFGEKTFGESYKMKPVQEPSKTETEATNKKSPVAPNAKSPVDGVKVVKTDTSEDTTEPAKVDYKVEDNNNVMSSDKELLSPAKVPTHTAEKSDSVVPKRGSK